MKTVAKAETSQTKEFLLAIAHQQLANKMAAIFDAAYPGNPVNPVSHPDFSGVNPPAVS